MKFDIGKTVEILRQTPYTLERFLAELSPEWTQFGGGFSDWSPYDVLGHLIHAEETDWIPRAEIILSRDGRAFEKFDRMAQFEHSAGKGLAELLEEFAHVRSLNIEKLLGWELTPEHLALEGFHPDLGRVTLEQLIATWAVHDLNHIGQIAEFMARQYEGNVGPWVQYLGILHKKKAAA
ncbi:MAG: DinB family protein [Acidobacteria bacterium]|nr:DinB family protein [Acidobacteriota bacterium]